MSVILGENIERYSSFFKIINNIQYLLCLVFKNKYSQLMIVPSIH